MISFIEYNNIGAVKDEVAISVDSSAVISYTIPAGKKGVSFQNLGTDELWFGGSTIDPAASRGNKLFANQTLIYKNVKSAFTIYFKCAAAKSTSIGVVNHD